jgi:hypothetical protein
MHGQSDSKEFSPLNEAVVANGEILARIEVKVDMLKRERNELAMEVERLKSKIDAHQNVLNLLFNNLCRSGENPPRYAGDDYTSGNKGQ